MAHIMLLLVTLCLEYHGISPQDFAIENKLSESLVIIRNKNKTVYWLKSACLFEICSLYCMSEFKIVYLQLMQQGSTGVGAVSSFYMVFIQLSLSLEHIYTYLYIYTYSLTNFILSSLQTTLQMPLIFSDYIDNLPVVN